MYKRQHKGIEPLYPDEWNAVVDGLDILYRYVAQLEERTNFEALKSDIKPAVDNVYDLGDVERSWREVWGHIGYFKDALYVQGRPVIKDGDPISVFDILEDARRKITLAIDYSTLLYSIYAELVRLVDGKKPELLGIEVNKHLYPGYTVFDTDLTVRKSGRVRVKLWSSVDGYFALKWTPRGFTDPIIGYLNAGAPIPARCWHEFDFTCEAEDKVNVVVYQTGQVTVAIYNIGEA